MDKREKIVREYNRKAKHQQDMVQGWWGCRTIAAGTHGSTPHILKTIKRWKKKSSKLGKPTKMAVNPESYMTDTE